METTSKEPTCSQGLIRRFLCVALLPVVVSCGGGGGSDETPPQDPPSSSVTIAPDSQIAAVSLGDEQQRIYVLPDEVTRRDLFVQTSAVSLTLDTAVTRGGEAVSVGYQSGRLVATIRSDALRAGAVLPYEVTVKNHSTGTGAQVRGTVHVLAPKLVASGQVTEAGGVIESLDADVRIEFEAKVGATPLGVVVKVAEGADGFRKVRVEFDRSVVGDDRVVRIASPQPAVIQQRPLAGASNGRMRIASATTYPITRVRNKFMGKFTEVGGFRFDQSTVSGLNSACASEAQTGRIGCWDYQVAGQLNDMLVASSGAVAGAEPVIFVHGFTRGDELGGGFDTWGEFPSLLTQSSPRYLPFEFRWRTNTKLERAADDLAAAVLDISASTGKKVTIVAHSFGGNLARAMLQQLGGPKGTDWSRYVKQVVTLGTPHSGIYAKATTVGATVFPAGQDSLVFAACVQISCYQMGQDIYVDAPKTAAEAALALFGTPTAAAAAAAAVEAELLLLNSLKLDLKLGGIVQGLADFAVNPLPAAVPMRVGIGLAMDARLNLLHDVVGTQYRSGDALISLQGQRFSPRLLGSTGEWSGDLDYLKCTTDFGPNVEEILLGRDGRFPGQSFDLPVVKKGYGHTYWPLVSVLAHLPANFEEAKVECTTLPCDHDGYRLVKAALDRGACYPTVSDPESTITDTASADFSVVASGAAPLTYAWRINGANLVVDGNGRSGQCGTGFIAAGFNTARLSLSGLPAGCSGAVFDVVVGSGELRATSKTATLTVLAPRTAPTIKADEPKDASAVEGGVASFKVTATTTELVGLRYQWRLGLVALSDGPSILCGTVAGATTDTLTLSNIPLSCGGSKVSVEVTGSPGLTATSREALLTVTPGSPTPATPSVTDVLPATMTAGPAAQTLTVKGSGFSAGNVVQFKWGVGAGAGTWTSSIHAIDSLSPSQITLLMNPGAVADRIDVRVCKSAAQTAAADCSSNASTVTVTLPVVAPPDLIVSSATLAPNSVIAGGTLRVSFSIANQGTGAAAATTATIRINQSAVISAGTDVGSAPVSALAASASSGTLSVDVAAPTTAGVFQVWVIADVPRTAGQPEGATSNDATRASTALTVSPAPVAPRVDSFVAVPATPSVGIPAVFTITGSNLPVALQLNLPGCAGYILNGWSSTQQQFGCTPTQAGTNTAGSIVTSTGSTLYAFNVTVNPIVPAPGPSGLFVGYYSEDPTARNPLSNDLPHYALLYVTIPASGGGFTGVMDAKFVACQPGSDLGSISGTKSVSTLSGTWSGTFDLTSQAGSFSGTYNANSSSYYGDYTVAGGLQLISVPACGFQYSVYPRGIWEVLPIGGGSPSTFGLHAVGTLVTWTPEVGSVMTMVSVIDEQDALNGTAGAVKFLSKGVQQPASFNLSSVAGLVVGRTYIVSVTTATTYSQRTGSSSIRVVR